MAEKTTKDLSNELTACQLKASRLREELGKALEVKQQAKAEFDLTIQQSQSGIAEGQSTQDKLASLGADVLRRRGCAPRHRARAGHLQP